MDQSHLIAQQVRSNLPANLPQLDPAALSRLKQQALDAARQLQQQVQGADRQLPAVWVSA